MKWFKHMTDANRDEKLDELIQKHGLKAYARYWLILETIAEQMDESDKCEVTLSDVRWAMILRSRRGRSTLDLRCIADLGLIYVQSSDGRTTCKCPNLLKIKARQKPIGNKKGALEVEVEVEVDKEVDTPIPPTRKAPVKKKIQYPAFDEFWDQYPRKESKQRSRSIWISKKLCSKKENILLALENHKKSDQWVRDDGKFIPHPSTWLNQARWEDQIFVHKTWQEKAREELANEL